MCTRRLWQSPKLLFKYNSAVVLAVRIVAAHSGQGNCLAVRRLSFDLSSRLVEVAAPAAHQALPERQVLGVHCTAVVFLDPVVARMAAFLPTLTASELRLYG